MSPEFLSAHIRVASPSDAAALLDIYAPYVRDTAISFETQVPDPDEFAGRIEKILALLPWLVCETDDRILGYAYASPHGDRAAYRWGVDVSVYLHPDARGQGLGRRLYTSLFGQLRSLGYVMAYAGITLPNPASVKLHEAMGFTPVGVFRQAGYKLCRWHDVGWWQLSLQLAPASPEEPETNN